MFMTDSVADDKNEINSELNSQVFDTELPNIHQIEMQEIDAKYAATNLKLGLVSIVFCLLVVLIIFLLPSFDWQKSGYKVLLIGSSIFSLVCTCTTLYHWLADPLKTYALREHDLSFQSGLIFRKKVTQPITRIQHIELKRGPIERKIGLATLQVFSAGGSHHTFEIPGLELTKAQKLRQFILQHKDSTSHG